MNTETHLLFLSDYWKTSIFSISFFFINVIGSVNYKKIEDIYLNWKKTNKTLNEEELIEVKNVKDMSFVNSKGRPKEHKRIISLYDKLRQLAISQVNFFFKYQLIFLGKK